MSLSLQFYDFASPECTGQFHAYMCVVQAGLRESAVRYIWVWACLELLGSCVLYCVFRGELSRLQMSLWLAVVPNGVHKSQLDNVYW